MWSEKSMMRNKDVRRVRDRDVVGAVVLYTRYIVRKGGSRSIILFIVELMQQPILLEYRPRPIYDIIIETIQSEDIQG